MNTYSWYSALIKPSWAPPAGVFGPVWTVLYILIAISFGAVFYQTWKGEISKKVGWIFAMNLIFNLLYPRLQFGLHNNLLSSLDILLILGTLVWGIKSVWHRHKWIALINIPYLLWVTFATALQLTITYLN